MVGGSNLGLLKLTPPPPLNVSKPGFEPPTENFVAAALPFDQGWCDGASLPHCLKPVERKLLTPPHPTPPPHPPPPKKVISSSRGVEASESKNPLGDCLIGQNNDFTRGWTSNIMPWGMLRE